MKHDLLRFSGAKSLSTYLASNWVISIALEESRLLDSTLMWNFYLCPVEGETVYSMFSVAYEDIDNSNAATTFERLIRSALYDEIESYKEEFDYCDEFPNPFDENEDVELVCIPSPKVIATYAFANWNINVILNILEREEPIYEFYLAPYDSRIVKYSYSIPAKNIDSEFEIESIEEIILNNIEDDIRCYKKLYDDDGDNLFSNPFDE